LSSICLNGSKKRRPNTKLGHTGTWLYVKPLFNLLVQTVDDDLRICLPLFRDNFEEIFKKLWVEQLLAIFIVEDELPVVLRESLVLL